MLDALLRVASFIARERQLIARERRRRRELRSLLDKDDWILRDIGLTQVQIRRAMCRPLPERAVDPASTASHGEPRPLAQR